MALSLVGSEARAARLGAWSPAKEAQLEAMTHDLTLIGQKLSEAVLDRADYGEISTIAEQVKAQLNMAGVR